MSVEAQLVLCCAGKLYASQESVLIPVHRFVGSIEQSPATVDGARVRGVCSPRDFGCVPALVTRHALDVAVDGQPVPEVSSLNRALMVRSAAGRGERDGHRSAWEATAPVAAHHWAPGRSTARSAPIPGRLQREQPSSGIVRRLPPYQPNALGAR